MKYTIKFYVTVDVADADEASKVADDLSKVIAANTTVVALGVDDPEAEFGI